MGNYEFANQLELIETFMKTTISPVCFIRDRKIVDCNLVFETLIGLETIANINEGKASVRDIFIHKSEINDEFNVEKLLSTENTVKILNQEGVEQTFIVRGEYLSQNQCFLIYLQNITQRIEYENELLKLLYTDGATGLPNRTKLIDELQRGELDITSISLIDIKSFKEINDFYGHRIGDEILKELGQIIKNEITKVGSELKLYKFPADIYCITNTAYDKELFETTITHIVDLIDKQIFYFEPHEINTRVTAGISFSEKNNKLITADLALQAAKKDNKDYLIFYEELDNLQEYENNMKWTKKVKNALKDDNIVVYYQPLINNETLKADKYECLVRMKDDDRIVSPFFFLEVSKKSNQYVHITKIVIDKACKKFSDLPYEFSVNISYEDIEDPGFYFFIEETIKKYNVQKKIVFEILEDENVKNYDVLIEFIEKIKGLGCKVAIDDFGSGYSNFEHLLKMKVDYLKIDASLIKNIAVDENSYKITKTIVDFAKSLNMKTIAEFVENKEIFEIVKELDCNFSQGYYFSAPLENPTYESKDLDE